MKHLNYIYRANQFIWENLESWNNYKREKGRILKYIFVSKTAKKES